jgi:hypothetical protein
MAARHLRAKPAAKPASGLLAFFSLPRIIGLMLIIIAAITFALQTVGGALALLMAGLALVLARTAYANSVLESFIGSFRRWFVIITTALYDTVFWLLLFISGKTLGKLLVAIAGSLTGVDTTAQGIAALEIVQANNALIRGAFAGVILSSLAWIIVLFLAHTAARWLVWQAITERKALFKRWLGGNALWWAVWILPGVLFGLGLRPEYATIGFGLLSAIFIHLGSIYHRALVHNAPRAALAKAFGTGLGRLHRFIVPYALALMTYIILFQPFRFIPLAGRSQIAVYLVFSILFLGWLRVFLDAVLARNMPQEGRA